MIFRSLLFEQPNCDPPDESLEAPAFFNDLKLDQIVENITGEWKEYNLRPFYYAPLRDVGSIVFRQEILQDLEDPALMAAVKLFSQQMRGMRERLSQSQSLSHNKYGMERRFMGAVEIYCEAIERLEQDLSSLDIGSRGLLSFREYALDYATSVSFRDLVAEIAQLREALTAIRYSLVIKDDEVTVRPFDGQSDYSIDVEETFEKFSRGTKNPYCIEVRERQGMNHIEARILDRVALLFPAAFHALDAFCAAHAGYLDERISRFDREVQFYVAYLTYIEKFRRAGLSFCRPQLSQTTKESRGRNAFDLALADKLLGDNTTVVTNNFSLSGQERILVVSGPNQGGKTTFARMFGQVHYLAKLGCLVPGTEAQLFVFDHLFAHFEREEQITNRRGKLRDDLIRVRRILDEATPNSLIIMNELFSSTTVKDALYLGRQLMGKVSRLDLLCIWVTFLDELSSFNEKTVSMVSAVDPENPEVRTFRLERRPADGLAYALAIAKKYHVTYPWLKERIKA